MLSTSNSPSKQQYMTPRNTAVVTRPSLEKLRYTNNSTSNQIYDIFNSPFHTPSLFGTGTVTPSTLKNDANNDDYLDRYCCSREDFRFFQSTSPESLFNMMADIECSSSSSENTRAHSPKCDLFGESSSTMTVGDMLRPDYSTAATATTATATTPVGPPILYYPSQSKVSRILKCPLYQRAHSEHNCSRPCLIHFVK
ncbi:hypothetical protein BDF20DRAFT_391985 [Mycotypha africana]|uniref:uncharacterized protein n=1 Tax=Mycotypha africana TaxID=64632 RepID=UPI002300F389|nr:uncharacterized protein BDF20DRAFT_391985 [Mycotypha africana]KAI8984472.1 hypothetical protein BDF20DRAFT_391985 [Mycotypha africana]